MPVLHRRRQFYSLFPGLLLAPEEAQGAGEEVWARVEKGMRGHFGMAWTQGPEVIFHWSVSFAKVEKEEEEEEEINEMSQIPYDKHVN